MKERYTIADLAQMTMLSDKTIRNYIRQGILRGTMEGGRWYFTGEEFSRFCEDPAVQPALQAKGQRIWAEFHRDTAKTVPSLCATADFPTPTADAAAVLRNKVLALVDATAVEMRYTYDHRKKLTRIMLSGPLGTVLTVLEGL